MNTYDLLVAARDVFARIGGAKHVLVDECNKVCAVGAINMADHEYPNWGYSGGFSQEPVFKVRDLLNAQFENDDENAGYEYAIVDYNNRDDITKDDVLAIFDKAIARYEEKVR